MDNQSDKSQEATPYKLEEARKKGQIGKSAEFVSIVSLIAMMSTLIIMLPGFAQQLNRDMSFWLENANQLARSDYLLLRFVKNFAIDSGSVLVIMLFVGAITSIVSSILHGGAVFSFFPLKFSFAKLNPVDGMKRIFSKKGFFEIIKLLLKMVFIAVIAIFVWGQIKSLVAPQHTLSVSLLLQNWKRALVCLVNSFLALFFVFALVDLWFSKREFSRKMRMSTRDLKDEYRKREGDPAIKHKRKKNMLQLIKSVSSVARVKDADVIITNPTHYAIALQYRPNKMPLPKVVSKGRGYIAKLIMRQARRSGVPILRRPSLARKIYKDAANDAYIPTTEQVSVAEVYRDIIKLPGSKVFL